MMLAMNNPVFVAILSVWGLMCFTLGATLERRLERREKLRAKLQSLQLHAEADIARRQGRSVQSDFEHGIYGAGSGNGILYDPTRYPDGTPVEAEARGRQWLKQQADMDARAIAVARQGTL